MRDTLALAITSMLATAASGQSPLSITPSFADASGGATITLTKAEPFASPVHAEVKCAFGSQQVREAKIFAFT